MKVSRNSSSRTPRMNLQIHYDLVVTEEKLAGRLAKEVTRHAA